MNGKAAAVAIDLPSVTLPPEAVALREEVRAFLREERKGAGFVVHCDAWLRGFDPEFSKKLGARGWLGMTWPRQYGGHERSMLERFVLTEELLVAGAPVAAHWIADRQMGPSILRHGSEAQKQRILPKISAGECFFSIGMSEPDSGSDLASVRTSAQKADGGWRLNGTKVWTSHAHRSHYLMTLVRTSGDQSSRQQGLSQMIVDLAAPGVTVRPIALLTGEHDFAEVNFEDVFLPDDMVLGDLGAGWHQVTSELAFERGGPERILSTYPLLMAAIDAAAERGGDAAETIGSLVARLVALRQMSLGVAGLFGTDRMPNTEAALVKDLGTRFEAEVIDAARSIARVEPSLESDVKLERLLADAILHAPGFTLRGGTNEILRGIVARGLGVR